MNDQPHHDAAEGGISRKTLLGRGALVAGAVAAPSLFGGAAAARASGGDVALAPKYRPLAGFRPDLDLTGKLAVITGASRGNGRAVGEALAARGVDVIGTSRDPSSVPDPPSFPLLKLDVADPASVLAFPARVAAHRLFRRRGQVDILANNAGRFVFGQIVPGSPANLALYATQRELAVRTLYSGHVMVTDAMLPLLAQQGYSRIVFTVSVASYYTGATLAGASFIDAYGSGKAALRTYADNLGAALQQGGSAIRVSTVNPYVMHTGLAEHPHPIYTQPVNASGLSDTDPVFNAVVTGVRQLLANGQPPSQVGETYAQLLALNDPDPSVVVGSPNEPLRTQGGNALIEPQLLAENARSAMRFIAP